MYTQFFGLNEKPFAITPNPRYLFMSARHGEGLAHLVYGVTEGGGFIQLTGEVGTGKTTLVRTLLGKLPDEVDIALILNPQITVVEFLQVICQELEVPPPEDKNSGMALVDALNRYLLDAHSRGRRTILLVDEAQNLSDEVLEQLRLLTNLETAKQKLLQIILIGQPELREVLAKNNLRQLAQRVTGRYHLEPLSRDEAIQYIEHRMKVAGSVGDVFETPAKREVYRLSRGIPRVMNVICDRALLGAYGQESRKVTRKTVQRAANEVSGHTSSPRFMNWAAGMLAVSAAVLIGFGLWPQETAETDLVETATAAPVDAMPDLANPRTIIPAEALMPDVNVQSGFEQQLTSGSVDATLQGSMTQLLALWGVNDSDTTAYDCAQIASIGFSCLSQSGSWNVLRLLDRPAILTLVDDSGKYYRPLVTSLDESTVKFIIDGVSTSYSLDEISNLWFGRYLIVWRPPNGTATAIAPGMRNINVIWLRESLATLGHEATTNNSAADFFDGVLESQLRNFQRQHRLQVDGIAGEQTQIIINSMLAISGTPRLSGDS